MHTWNVYIRICLKNAHSILCCNWWSPYCIYVAIIVMTICIPTCLPLLLSTCSWNITEKLCQSRLWGKRREGALGIFCTSCCQICIFHKYNLTASNHKKFYYIVTVCKIDHHICSVHLINEYACCMYLHCDVMRMCINYTPSLDKGTYTSCQITYVPFY